MKYHKDQKSNGHWIPMYMATPNFTNITNIKNDYVHTIENDFEYRYLVGNEEITQIFLKGLS